MISRNIKSAEERQAKGDRMRTWRRISAGACDKSMKIILTLGAIAMSTTMIAPVTMNTSATTAISQPRLVAMESGPAPAEIGGTYSKIVSAAVDNSGDAWC